MTPDENMLRVAYDITSLAESPLGGIARVCYHTARQAAKHPEISPVGCYRSGSVANLAGLDIETRRLHPLSGVLPPTYDIAHSLCHRTLNVKAGKSVYHVHDVWSLNPNPYQGEAFQRKVGRRLRDDIVKADFVIAISETTRRNILDLDLIPPDRCRAVYLGHDPSDGDSSVPDDKPFILPTDRPYVLFVGCFEVRKNLGHIVDAVKPLAGVHLVLAGSPGFGYDDRIKPKLTEFPSDRLHLLSDVGRNGLRHLYRNALALLLPSWEEGFGLPIVEAMANGCPVVTSNRSANAEVGAGGAILIDPENPDESKQAIERLLDDSDFRSAKIASGKTRAGQFTWDKYYNQLVKVYRQVLSI